MASLSYQDRVWKWMVACFKSSALTDKDERNHRYYEESTELVQACGMSRAEAHQLVDYTYDRPIGEKGQEVGGVLVTLAALCKAQDLDMFECGETELARVWTKIDVIREKQAAKPKFGPLPKRTVDTIPDSELLGRAVRSARARHGRLGSKTERWVAIMDSFGLGSTFAHQLCRRFGFDPDELVAKDGKPNVR